jgi:hypothetical protein
MNKRRPKIIKDKKERGEWAESVFLARAAENGLPVSKPIGDSRSFDCVVGRTRGSLWRYRSRVPSQLEGGKGYICNVCSCHKACRAGAFDFLAAYVIPEDAWYIIPAKLFRGLKSISLCTADGGEAKYEEYREAWNLLKSPLLAKAARNGAPESDESEATDCDESHLSQNQGEMGHPQTPAGPAGRACRVR